MDPLSVFTRLVPKILTSSPPHLPCPSWKSTENIIVNSVPGGVGGARGATGGPGKATLLTRRHKLHGRPVKERLFVLPRIVVEIK